MELRILGPLEAVAEGRTVHIRGQKQRELLAILGVHANEVVSADRLIDELWGESPPASAVKTLRAYISRLRKSLGETRALTTHGHGYSLVLSPGELDSQRFASLLDDGRRALAAGEPDRAAETLTEALALWRGPALADFAYASFAQSEIARLEELRLAAQEERVEADIARGRHADVIPELEALVVQHPLRERPRGQLMLALYRSGRQAEALQTYQEGRRALAEELGLEPSQSLQQLERRILEHDPGLSPPSMVTQQAAQTRSKRRLAIVVAAAVVLLVMGIGATVARVAQKDGGTPSAGAAALDLDTGEILGTVDLGTSPSSVAIGEGYVWVLDADDKTVSQIDPDTREIVRTFSTSSTPTDIAVGAGALWVGNAGATGGLLPESVSRIDPASGVLTETIDLARTPPGDLFGRYAGPSTAHIAVSPDAVWVLAADRTITRIDPRTNDVVARIDGVEGLNIAAGEGDVWVGEPDHLAEIDTVRNAVARRVHFGSGLSGTLAIGGGAVWMADKQNERLLRVTTDARAEQSSVEVDPWVAGVAFGEGAVWATSEIDDAVFRIDPRGGEPTRIAASAPRGVAAGDGVVWATVSAPPSRDAALPTSVCGDVYFEKGGEPDLLLVSDLALKGDPRPMTQAMVDAVRYTLEQRGFEAGAFSVGYQSCDSTTAQATGGFDLFRCASNARAYARNLRVVAVFGSFESQCSSFQVEITNEAEDGPLAMLSPSSTLDDLITDAYPTGIPSFFGIAAPYHLQGAAQIALASQLGRDRLYLLESSEMREFKPLYEQSVRTAAKRLGIDVVGHSVFDPAADDLPALAREVARKRPEAIVIASEAAPGAGRLVRDLHAVLGPDVPLLVPNDFRLIDDLVALVGPATGSLFVAEYRVPNEKLPPRGRQFLDTFADGRGGDAGPDLSASYGAQGAEILLDAIARSNGTRASVLEEIRKTRVEGGILGDIAFDRNGDLREAPITMYRVENGEFVVDRVVIVRARAGVP
ncbi:MAG: BTAD domain-containing putative transcriptional regulator [Gaiellaceae bacterium]